MRLLAVLLVMLAALSRAHASAQPCTEADVDVVGPLIRGWMEAVRDLGPDTDMANVRARYDAMATSRCGADLAQLDMTLLLTSWRALRVYIGEGGSQVIQHLMAHSPDQAAVFPDPPSVLRSSTLPPTDALRALLCTDDDVACQAESASFRARTDDWLRMHDELEREHRMESETRDAHGVELAGRCTAAAMAEPEARRFGTFVGCARTGHAFSTILPEAPARLPTTGSIVLRGRRGHYGYCDEVRAYDLATGAAYVASTCDQLALMGGTAPPVQHDEAGRVPIAPLRELALFLALSRHIQTHAVGRFLSFTLAQGIHQPPPGTATFGTGGGSSWGSSDQTDLAWAWSRGHDVVAEGTITWPDSADSREAYANQLIRTMEAGWVVGCAPAPLPRGLPLGTADAAVSPIDASPGALASTEMTLESRLGQIRAPRCRPGR